MIGLVISQEESDVLILFENLNAGSLYHSFPDLVKEIEESKYILNQRISPDDVESPLYTTDAWIRGIKFIIKYANHIFSKEKQLILNPKIYHGPNGSIDFYWQYPHLNMLLNVPPQGKGSFSGDDGDVNKFNGFFNPDEPNFKFIPSIF